MLPFPQVIFAYSFFIQGRPEFKTSLPKLLLNVKPGTNLALVWPQ